MSLDYVLASLVVVLLPGTGVLYTLAVGVNAGSRASLFAAFGCTLGVVPHIAIGILGLSALMHASATAFTVVTYLGVAYLLYMAVMVLRGGGLEMAEDGPKVSPMRIVVTAIILNVLNPKLTLFFLAFLPQFIAPGSASPTRELLGLAGVFMLITFLVFVAYGLFAGAARKAILARPAVIVCMRRGFAASFALLSLRLALDSR